MILEKIGEKTIELCKKFFYILLDITIAVLKLLVKADSSVYSLFEKRGIERRDFLIFKVQAISIVLLGIVIFYIFRFISLKFIFFAFILFLSGIYYILSIRKYIPHDFPAYRDFFLSYLSIPWIFLLINKLKPSINFVYPYIHYIIFAFLYAIVFSYYFRRRYMRDYTYGRVLKADGTITVRVNYDLRANVKPKILTFKNDINAREGDILILKVKKRALNLRGAEISGVEGKVRVKEKS